MPWLETGPMDQRMQLITDILNGLGSITDLSDMYGVSRKTAYKWLARFKSGGLAALADQSRRPHGHPDTTPVEVSARLISLRKAHPLWGPRKVRAMARREDATCAVPAVSTVGRILHDAGLVEARVRRPRSPQGAGMSAAAVSPEPHQVWCADFKGHFRMGDGRYCYPLTVTDFATRNLLCCQGMHAINTPESQVAFEALFYAHGLPERIHTDNGAPFASSQAIAGLTTLAVWWIERGIAIERSRPHCPQDNGRHERMHRSLAAAVTRPPRHDLAAQQAAFDQFRHEFNHHRPHEALNDAPPISCYRPSPREYTGKTVDPAYPGHWETRRVSHNGLIRFRGQLLPIPSALAGRDIALEPIDDDAWRLVFHRLILGTYRRKGPRWAYDVTGYANRLRPRTIPAPAP